MSSPTLLSAVFQVEGDTNVTVPAARGEDQGELQRVSNMGSYPENHEF